MGGVVVLIVLVVTVVVLLELGHRRAGYGLGGRWSATGSVVDRDHQRVRDEVRFRAQEPEPASGDGAGAARRLSGVVLSRPAGLG